MNQQEFCEKVGEKIGLKWQSIRTYLARLKFEPAERLHVGRYLRPHYTDQQIKEAIKLIKTKGANK